ncbi:hypothetical protein PHLCEN_2v991 [Hermanssonia centrifuga]|uniref:GP-PDE domain-containing protein n=1 Tax=Hermanssonia centrifuga TaxID=98765 RepID=A0A2R6S4A6_9APHY|nr:hypothetical protein PHLCEN_2v991 [Hermanssonia centrifuga]
MFPIPPAAIFAASHVVALAALPAQESIRVTPNRFYDVQDGYVVVWHDEEVTPEKCLDTFPAFPNDPDFPYIGKFIANLTLAQLKTLDCGSKRQDNYRPDTATGPGNTSTPWLAGLDLSAFPGPGLDQKVAQAAKYIRADVLSPAAVSDFSPVNDPKALGFIPFTTKAMVDEAHGLGVEVKPWTVNRLNVVEQLLEWKVDGIISDYPNAVRRVIKQKGLPAAPKYPKQRVLSCLTEHLAKQQNKS